MRSLRMLLACVIILIGSALLLQSHSVHADDPTDGPPPTNTHAPTATDMPTIPPTNTRFPTQTLTPTFTASVTLTSTTNGTATFTPTSTRTATSTPTPTPIADAVTKQGFRLLNGPGYYYLEASLVGPGTQVSIISRTDDNTWIEISYLPAKNQPVKQGWLEAKALMINIDLNTVKPITSDQLNAIQTTNPCTAIVGDSVAHGGAVFEIPETGYARAPLAPVSYFVSSRLRAIGIPDKTMKVYDRSVSATGISTSNHPSYMSSPEFAQLHHDHCKFTVVLPWINDLSPDGSVPDPSVLAPAHANALALLVHQIAAGTPYGRILVYNYYMGNPTKFALTSFATGFKPAVISAFNAQIAAACAGGGLALPQVTCLDISLAFGGLGLDYVVGPMTRDEINKSLISAINADELKLFNYWADGHPGGQMLGDGVHLNTSGKIALANAIVAEMQILPDLKPYQAPTKTPTITTTPPTATPIGSGTTASTPTNTPTATPAG